MSTSSPEILCKGSSFIGVLKALEALRGPGAREQILEHLPEEFAAGLRYGHLLVVGWYPVEWYAQLHSAIDASFHGDPLFARKLSHHATSSDIGSIYRQVISLLKIHTVFGQTPRIMGLYWKGGMIERLVVEQTTRVSASRAGSASTNTSGKT